MSRQAWILVALVGVLGASAWWNLRGDEALTGAARGRASRSAEAELPFEAADVPVVNFARSSLRPGETFTSIRKNLFVYEKSPAVVAAEEEARRRAEEASRLAALEAAKRAEEERILKAKRDADEAEARRKRQEELARNPPPPPPPVPPDFGYQYVGVIGPEETRYAILVSGAKSYSFAKAGDVIDQQFRVERVGRLNLDLSYLDSKFEGQLAQVPRLLATGGAGSPSSPTPSSPRTRK